MFKGGTIVKINDRCYMDLKLLEHLQCALAFILRVSTI